MDITQQLIRDEGVRLKPYLDTVGKTTIGIGRNLTDIGISDREARFLLANDIQHVENALSQAFPWTDALDGIRRSALVNMSFNLGIGGLSGFKNMLSHLQAGEYDSAAEAMTDSKWAEQVGARAQRLALQIRTGQWQ